MRAFRAAPRPAYPCAAPDRQVAPAGYARSSLTSPIRPAVAEFSSGKSLNGKERRGPNRQKSALVPTKSILSAANVPIIGGHHVPALQSSPEAWSGGSPSGSDSEDSEQLGMYQTVLAACRKR